MCFREPHSRRPSCFYAQNDFQVDPADKTTAPPNLAQSSTKSNLTRDHNATGRPNLVNPNRHRDSEIHRAGECAVSPLAVHAALSDRAITCEAAPKPRYRSPSPKHSLGAGATPTRRRAAPPPRRAAPTHRHSRPSSAQRPAFCGRLSARPFSRAPLAECTARPRLAPSAKNDAKLGTRVVTNHQW
jgi:hypothetical protein